MEIMARVVFGFYAALIVAGALMAVVERGLVRSLVGLIATMFGVAGLYMLMAAPIVAFMQILIYVGGVSILIFFSIMLTKARPTGDEAKKRPFRKKANALLASLVVGIILASVLIKFPIPSLEIPRQVNGPDLGDGLLGPYLLPFELISVVLFVAMAAAVALAWQQWGKSK
jgi:NADH-quinone oxidoreductase subunit J